MILFEEDWAKYPTAMPDLDTKNRSFIDVCGLLKRMGIKNHTFPLALVQQELKNVDPHDPDLTPDQIAKITLECKINPWYFFREVARAPAGSGEDATPIRANRGNIALWWLFLNHIFFVLIQPRQTGKSFGTGILLRLLLNVLCRDTKISGVTKDDRLRQEHIQNLKDIADELPWYLQLKQFDDANNTEIITVNKRGNRYITYVPQASKKNAYKQGRGSTSPIVYYDEAPFQINISIAMPAMLAVMGDAKERAQRAGAPYGVIITTTAGKIDDPDGGYIYKIMMDAAEWTEHFYDCKNLADLEATIRRHCRGDRIAVAANFSHRQLGKTDEWIWSKIVETGQTADDANRDYFGIWTAGSETMPFSIEMATRIGQSKRDPDYVQNWDGYFVRWYIPEAEIETRMNSSMFVMGADTSEAGGGDDISLFIRDVQTGETIAAGNYNNTNILIFCQFVAKILIKFKNILLIPERKSTGSTLVDSLFLLLSAAGEDPLRRIFNRIVNDADEFPEKLRELRSIPLSRRDQTFYAKIKTQFGFMTSGAGTYSRSALYSTTLNNALKMSADVIYDSMTCQQLLGLVNKNGRIDHRDGEHDDMVIGFLLTHWLLTQGKNLSYYGIDPSTILIANRKSKELSIEERYHRIEQDNIRRNIESLYEAMDREQDDYVLSRLEHELRVLERKLILEEDEIFSVDELIRSVRDSKRRAPTRNYQSESIFSAYDPSRNGFFDQSGWVDRPPVGYRGW